MSGIGTFAGIARDATLAALKCSKIDVDEKNLLRELLCGCLWTQKRQHEHGAADSPLCRLCEQEAEDEGHILWRCPRWEPIRFQMQALVPSVRELWPLATMHQDMRALL